MRLDPCCAIVSALWLCAVCGCAHPPICLSGVGPPPPAQIPIAPAPAPVTVDWKSFRAADEAIVALTSAVTAAGYRTLTEQECHCWAVEQSTLGNMLDAERQLVCTTQRDCHGRLRPQAALLVKLLAISAADARYDAATTATELFYRLAEAHLQGDVLKRSLAEVDQAIADFRQLKERGIALPTDESKLETQRLDLYKRQSELHAATKEAEGQLCRLLGLTADPDTPLSPAIDLRLDAGPIDADDAIAAGMQARPDLASLRVLCQAYERGHLAVVRRGLQQVHAQIGSSTPEGGLLMKLIQHAHRGAEAPTRGVQLHLAFADQTRGHRGNPSGGAARSMRGAAKRP